MDAPYHRQITIAALERQFSPRALEAIIAANLGQDSLRGLVGHPEYHFDDSAFKRSYAYLDAQKRSLFDALKDRKADTIFSAVADRLKEHGLELVNSTFLLKEYLAPKGTLTKRAPTLHELDDIAFGTTIAKEMGGIDVGQTVVVKDKAIVAIEAMEGTDRTIMRGGAIAQNGAVVVKMSKPNQDLRFDVPVVGPRTIKAMMKSKAKCLGVEAGKTLIIDRNTCVKLANKADICIVGA